VLGAGERLPKDAAMQLLGGDAQGSRAAL